MLLGSATSDKRAWDIQQLWQSSSWDWQCKWSLTSCSAYIALIVIIVRRIASYLTATPQCHILSCCEGLAIMTIHYKILQRFLAPSWCQHSPKWLHIWSLHLWFKYSSMFDHGYERNLVPNRRMPLVVKVLLQRYLFWWMKRSKCLLK